jgi:hypothetical protein
MGKSKLLIFAVLGLSSLLSFTQTKESKHAPSIEPKPDLVPLLSHPMDGKIVVKNIGHGSAKPSKMTLDCEKVGTSNQMYSCPNLPISVMSDYFDATFPNNATIQVPALPPGATYTHTLSFWGQMKWPRGEYRFTAVVDAAHALSESNTKNNTAISLFTVQEKN